MLLWLSGKGIQSQHFPLARDPRRKISGLNPIYLVRQFAPLVEGIAALHSIYYRIRPVIHGSPHRSAHISHPQILICGSIYQPPPQHPLGPEKF